MSELKKDDKIFGQLLENLLICGHLYHKAIPSEVHKYIQHN